MAVKFYLLGIERQMDIFQTQENQVYDLTLIGKHQTLSGKIYLFFGNFDYKVTYSHFRAELRIFNQKDLYSNGCEILPVRN